MYQKLFPYFFPFPKKTIKKISLGLVLLAMNDGASYAMDENESNFSSKSALSHQTSKKYTFADWMYCIGRNAFKAKSP
jgi:hypothetical protein